MDLTKEQIVNWRNVLVGQLGPIALMLSDDYIQSIKDNLQRTLEKPVVVEPKQIQQPVDQKPFNTPFKRLLQA